MIFALAGNQNCGKTTLFNALTGSNQHVGNFPGVTVDRKIGDVRGAKDCQIVDLPGVYSIRPYSSEEIVTRDFILKNHPDGIINIIDASNIERNLYLTLQLLELRIPTVIALNMMDEVRENGGSVDVVALSEKLGVPVVPVSAAKSEGIEELVSVSVDTAKRRVVPKVYDFCGEGPIHRCIHSLCHVVEDHAAAAGIPARFAAMKLIENDIEIVESLDLDKNELELAEHDILQMEDEEGLDRNAAIATMRYDFIESVTKDTVIKPHESRERLRSIAIDKVVTDRYLAIPIFFGVMFLIFWATFGPVGSFFCDLIARGIDSVTAVADAALTDYGINPIVHSLVIDGIFSGVGSVLSFLPLIVILFFFLSVLEDTGYMARVAFVMDKLLRRIGLSGRSFVPMLVGFGCSVPAIMATRTLPSERDRKMTIMLTPFMSCSAKIPIYAVFAAAFFPGHEAAVMISLYAIGIVMAILIALLFKGTIFKGKPVPFVMELPNYRFPSFKSVGLLLWEKTRDFVSRAFSVILIASVVIWFFQSFDSKLFFVENSADSILASIGALLVPVFEPLGFSDWRIPTSLISGLIAKETIISTLGVLTETATEELPLALSGLFPGASAVGFLVFTLLYTPCIAAIATIKKELGSAWQAAGVVVFQCVVAWICGYAAYLIACMV